MLAVIMKQSL